MPWPEEHIEIMERDGMDPSENNRQPTIILETKDDAGRPKKRNALSLENKPLLKR